MKKNFPVTQQEVALTENSQIISTTDLKGAIVYANKEFVDISGFSYDELHGVNHNIVRHPDMPMLAFRNLWETLKAGNPWMGIVKNRCKNGDHYWVDAFVMPIYENHEVVGYQSVRRKPEPEHVRNAEKIYKNADNGKLGIAARLVGLWKLSEMCINSMCSRFIILLNDFSIYSSWRSELVQ